MVAPLDPRRQALSALMVAQQREEDGAPRLPPDTAAMPGNWIPPDPKRALVGEMPTSPATQVAMARQAFGDAPLGTQYLEEGLGADYAPARAKMPSGMASGTATDNERMRADLAAAGQRDGENALALLDRQFADRTDSRERMGVAGLKDGANALAMLERGQGRPFKGISPEDEAELAAQQERFQQGLRLRGEPTQKPPGGGARRPQVAVSQVGPSGPVPQARPLAAPRVATVNEGTPAALGRDAPPAPTGDTEFAAAQAQADDRRRSVALGRAGAQINKALSGVDYDAAAYNGMEQDADSPVRRLLEQREADKRKALDDPTSDASRRVQAAVAKAMPGVYSPDELARITAGDADMVTKYGAMRQRLEERKTDMAREDALRAAKETREDTLRADERRFQAQQAGAGRAFQAQQSDKAFQRQKELAALNNAADLEQAAMRAKLGPDGLPVGKGTTIPGLEVEPGAAPTAEDAKKVKASRVAAEKMRGYVAELRDLHSKYGTEYGGAAGTRMEQLGKAIQLEAKTIAELGALSGPDQALMESIAGADPSSLGANVKALVGIDNTATALQGLEKWVGTQEGATQRVYGYRPAGGQPQAGGDMVPMLDPQGRQRMVPRARVQDAISAGGRLVNG